MTSIIKFDYILENANDYIGKEVTIVLKGYVKDIDLINNTIMYGYFDGKRKPHLLNQETELSVIATDIKIEV